MSIQSLVGNGSIRIFNTESAADGVIVYPYDLPTYELASDDTKKLEFIGLMEFVYSRSPTFRNVINQVSPSSALWIDLDNDSNVGSGIFFGGGNAAIPDVMGLVMVEPADGLAQMITSDGRIVGLESDRVFIHEVAHALLGAQDPNQNLDGLSATPRSHYQGGAVEFENEVMAEIYGTDASGSLGERTSYNSVGLGLLRLVEPGINGHVSLTFGRQVDLVLIDTETRTDEGVTVEGPGRDVNASNNIEHTSDLVIARVFDSNTISTGAGNDFIYAGRGNDVVYGGDDFDYLSGEYGDDSLFGGAARDTLVGGRGSDHLDGGEGSDLVDYSMSGAGVTINLATGAGSGGDADGASSLR